MKLTDHAERFVSATAIKQDRDLHRLLVLGAGAYAWQLHSFLGGIAVIVLLLLGIAVSNLLILYFSGNLRLLRVSRWGLLIAAYLLVGISGASGGSVS